jgi:hypothetical protein
VNSLWPICRLGSVLAVGFLCATGIYGQTAADATSPCSSLLTEFLLLEDSAAPQYADVASRNAGVIRGSGFDEYLRQVGGSDKTLKEARTILAKNQKILGLLETGQGGTVVTHRNPGETEPVTDPSEALEWQDSMLEAKISLILCWRSQPSRTDKCTQLVEYRDHGLLQQWDHAMAQYDIQQQGKDSIEDIKKKLLDDNWWATSSGPEIAAEIKYACDSLNDLIGAIFPEEQILKMSKPIIHHAPEILRAVQAGAPIVTYGKENAEAAAKEAWMDVGKDLMGQAGSAIGVMQDMEERTKTKGEWIDLRTTVQEQVDNLDRMISGYNEKLREAGKRLDAIEEVVIAIDQLCSQPSVSTPKP